MIRILFFFLSFTISEEDLQRVAKIDQDIVCLEKEKAGLLRQISLHGNKAGQLQFDRNNFLEARREFFLQQQAEDKMHVIEIKIKNLIEEKSDLLEE